MLGHCVTPHSCYVGFSMAPGYCLEFLMTSRFSVEVFGSIKDVRAAQIMLKAWEGVE